MKVVHVCPRYHPYIGGIETHVKEICERLSRKSFDVEVWTTDPSCKLLEEEFVNNVKVRRFKSWAPGEAYYFSRHLKKTLFRNSNTFDVIHAHGYSAFPSFYAGSAKGKNKLVFTPHYHETGHTWIRRLLHIPYKYLGKRTFEKADYIVCVSSYEKTLVVTNFEVDEKKIKIIPNGVSLAEFKNLEKKKNDYQKILYVGRLEKYKGAQYLINVLPNLNDHVKLEIVGKGPYEKNLARLAKKLNVEDRVSFFQDLPRIELLQKYADADLFVSLSQHEAFGISVAEALCAGTPCIVANTSALTEWIDGENCFGIDYPIDLDALADLIKKFSGKSVCKPAVLDWDEVANRLTKLYVDVWGS
jgi:glycosyltransferase involved in cell wall biosynthesis